ncbi:MAG: helix-turn-helix protein [Herbinix sp.]|jgi:transcriptional regulator with XRE-family HTH domain|nr:helix-turn-helix protein [Herbinix sp.]
MDNGCLKDTDNHYFRCRIQASLNNEKLSSREGAAELLGVSVSSLAKYEQGVTKYVPVDKVLSMAELYNAPELKGLYCKECCPLGADKPEIILEDLDRITLKAMSFFRKIPGVKDTLLDITEDGIISDDERLELDDVLTVLDELSLIAQTLKLWAEKNNQN